MPNHEYHREDNECVDVCDALTLVFEQPVILLPYIKITVYV